MEIGAWLATLAGMALIAVVLCDIFMAALHIDHDGLFAPWLHRGIWMVLLKLGQTLPRTRRFCLSLAGPVMIVSSFMVWTGLFILGFALWVWPFLQESFRGEPELGQLTFVDALYFSGGTATVLGLGDITPLSGPLKLLAILEAGLGFALMTGLVTYLLNVVSGVLQRNVLASQVESEIGKRGGGTEYLIECLRSEQLSDFRTRLVRWNQSLSQIKETMHQFPILDFYYRSLNPIRDPEPMIRSLTETAVASQILARQSRARRLGPASDDLAQSLKQLMRLMAIRSHGDQAAWDLSQPHSEPADEADVTRIETRLKQALGEFFTTEDLPPDRPLMEAPIALNHQARVFLTHLDKLTHWKKDHP